MRGTLTLGLSILATVLALGMAPPAGAACPPGSQFFAYGGSGGCVVPGSSKVVVKCFHMPKSCPSGWSQEHQDDEGKWCCPPPPKKKDPLPPAHDETCMWKGTAPFCKGRCAPGELSRAWSKDGSNARAYPGFGAECITGGKVYCCRLTFPNQ